MKCFKVKISKTVMNNVTNDQNGDPKTRRFSPARKTCSVSGVGSPFPPGKGTMPASGLQTAFSIAQSDHYMTKVILVPTRF